MMDLKRNRLAAVVGGVLLIVGLVVAADAWVRLGRDVALWNQRMRELADLQALGEQVAGFEAVRDAVRLQTVVPAEPDTAAIVREAFPDAAADSRRSRLPVDGGWTREDVELALPNVSAARIFQLIEAAERARPPLRLTRIDLRSRPSPGQVDVVLTFVRLVPEG